MFAGTGSVIASTGPSKPFSRSRYANASTYPSAVAPSPDWFADELDLTNVKNIVVLDDEETSHQMIARRLADVGVKRGSEYRLLSFFGEEELKRWIKNNHSAVQSTAFLVDVDLTGKVVPGLVSNGISVCRRLLLNRRATLISQSYYHEVIQRRCMEAGLKMIPKPSFTSIPVRSRA